MLREIENHFSEVEQKVIRLRSDYQKLKDDYSALLDSHNETKRKLDAEKKAHQELLEKYKEIKLVSAISGNPNHNRLMKNHINRLIKEIDVCIAQLQNKGL
ncbi:hypothetical protein PG614_04325 [Riemerella anatipestifer]|nr:hypothetical protein [Riemerella anatipestifer]MDY3534191.1 hypothetical protein [Riemerella anatipestifer]MDY3535168.1 hypothetical protein [Riemerella anatipestifer]